MPPKVSPKTPIYFYARPKLDDVMKQPHLSFITGGIDSGVKMVKTGKNPGFSAEKNPRRSWTARWSRDRHP